MTSGVDKISGQQIHELDTLTDGSDADSLHSHPSKIDTGGGGSSGRFAIWDDSSTIRGESDFSYNDSSNVLTMPYISSVGLNNIAGGASASQNLTLQSTSHATKGSIFLDSKNFFQALANTYTGFFQLAENCYTLKTSYAYSATSWHTNYIQSYRGRGTQASPTNLANGDLITQIAAFGYGGGWSSAPGQMTWTVDGSVSTGKVPMKCMIYVVDVNGAGIKTINMKPSGYIGFGKQNNPYATIDAKPMATTAVTAKFRGLTSQTGNLTEWRDGSDNILTCIDSYGRLGIGAQSEQQLMITSDVVDGARGVNIESHADSTGAARLMFKKSRGTKASPTTTVDQDYLAMLKFDGHDGTDYIQTSRMLAQADGSISTGIIPTKITFQCMDSSGSLIESVKLNSDGVTIPNSGLAFENSARIRWSEIQADSITLTTGTSSDSVTDLQAHGDGNLYNITEATGSPGVDLIVDFVDVEAFNWVHILAGYGGSSTHFIKLQMYNWNTTAWVNFTGMDDHGDETFHEDYSFFVPDDTNYIGTGGDLGKVRVRFNHTMAGNASHNVQIDHVSLYQ